MKDTPLLSREAVRAVDRCAIDEYQIPGMVLMENAGRGCTDILCRCGIDGPVVICCGTGNNAGDGLVIADGSFGMEPSLPLPLPCRTTIFHGNGSNPLSGVTLMRNR